MWNYASPVALHYLSWFLNFNQKACIYSNWATLSFIIKRLFINSDISWKRHTQQCELKHICLYTHSIAHTHTSWIIKGRCWFGRAGTADSEPPSHGPTFTAFITTCNIAPIPPFIPLYLATSPDHICIPPSLSIHHCIANPPVLF